MNYDSVFDYAVLRALPKTAQKGHPLDSVMLFGYVFVNLKDWSLTLARSKAVGRPEASRPAAKRRTRAEKADANRKALFAAAAKVVGEFGYKDASVARITQAAGLASGTFYVYFQSQQDLFEQLLPNIGDGILEYLSKSTPDSGSFAEAEEAWFRALFMYFFKEPGYFRILREAEVYAPNAFDIHLRDVVVSYSRGLRQWLGKGSAHRTNEDFEVVALMLTAIRPYLYKYYFEKAANKRKFEQIVDSYMDFILHGVLGMKQRSARRPKKGA